MIALKRTAAGIVEPRRVRPVAGEYDVIVVGGGMAGVGAGIAAARAGCRTLIIERESALGGLATVGLVNIPLDTVSGIGTQMFAQLEAMQALWHRHSDPEKHKLVLDRMVKAAGADVLLVTHVVEALLDRGRIAGVVVESKSGRQALLARRVVDASGDGDVGYFAGCPCASGRASDGINQACSLEFRLGGVDWDAYRASDLQQHDYQWRAAIKQALADGTLPYEVDNHLNWITHVPGRPEHAGMDEVSICFAHSRHCRPLDNRDLTRMYQEGREQAQFLWQFIRQRIPGFARSWLIDTAPLLGVRESRRVIGEYVMTGRDVASHAKFDDVVATSIHGFDIHHPTGPGNVKWAELALGGQRRCVIAGPAGTRSSTMPPGGLERLCDIAGRTGAAMQFPSPPAYDIPYRAIVPLGVDDLLVAGRCLSADFEAQSGTRLIMFCLTIGEAAGTAAALSLQRGVTPRALDRGALQRTLIANGVDLGQARRAIPGVTAS